LQLLFLLKHNHALQLIGVAIDHTVVVRYIINTFKLGAKDFITRYMFHGISS
jgi:hypothetical protein